MAIVLPSNVKCDETNCIQFGEVQSVIPWVLVGAATLHLFCFQRDVTSASASDGTPCSQQQKLWACAENAFMLAAGQVCTVHLWSLLIVVNLFSMIACNTHSLTQNLFVPWWHKGPQESATVVKAFCPAIRLMKMVLFAGSECHQENVLLRFGHNSIYNTKVICMSNESVNC